MNSARFCSWIGTTRVETVWMTPTARPPITAPSTLPRPPSTTAVNISTANWPPTVGDAVKYGRITAPPSAVMPTPRPKATWRMRRTSMPRLRAAAESCAVARMAWPSQVNFMNAHSSTPATREMPKASSKAAKGKGKKAKKVRVRGAASIKTVGEDEADVPPKKKKKLKGLKPLKSLKKALKTEGSKDAVASPAKGDKPKKKKATSAALSGTLD